MSQPFVMSIDAMGGDNAPDVVIAGLEYYLKTQGRDHDVRFIIHGDEELLSPLLAKTPLTKARADIAHTELAIEMGAKPSHALRRGKGTSMWNAIESVKDGKAIVGLSAGNTGALMAISYRHLRTMIGVQRPAIAAIWPQPEGMCVVLDMGANVDCDASHLTEFAVMGEAYFRALFHKDNPSIGLLNVGTEELKGNATIKLAHERLNNSELGLNYRGYVEGNDISFGDVDVIVTDGFTGNIALKTAEGTAKLISQYFKESLQASLWSKFTAFLNYAGFKRLQRRLDPRRANGGVFLGLNGIVIKSHGGTDAVGFANAVAIGVELAESDFLQEVERTLNALHDEDDNIGFVV